MADLSQSELGTLLGVQGQGDDYEVGGLSVTSGEIERLDAKIRNLDTDVMRFPQPPFFTSDGKGNPAFALWKGYKTEWQALMLAWSRWFQDHQTVLSQSTGTAAGEFETFEAKYNEMLRRFIHDFDGKTMAAPSKESGPVDGALTIAGYSLATVAVVGAIGLGAYMLLSAGAMRAARSEG